MKVYGLTGGIASGKSTVSRMIRARGVPVLDADEAARQVVEPGTPGLAAVVEAFGPGVLRADGGLDREELGRIIFAQPDARLQLNRIVHPLVQSTMAGQLAALAARGASLAVMDIPLLYEGRDPASFAGIIVVYVDEQTQRERLMARNGFSGEEADQRIHSQMSLEEKARRATFVIDNRGTLEETEAQLELLLDRLKTEQTEESEQSETTDG